MPRWLQIGFDEFWDRISRPSGRFVAFLAILWIVCFWGTLHYKDTPLGVVASTIKAILTIMLIVRALAYGSRQIFGRTLEELNRPLSDVHRQIDLEEERRQRRNARQRERRAEKKREALEKKLQQEELKRQLELKRKDTKPVSRYEVLLADDDEDL